MRGRIASCFTPHPDPLPMNLPLSLIAYVKSIVGKFTGRGTFWSEPSWTKKIGTQGNKVNEVGARTKAGHITNSR